MKIRATAVLSLAVFGAFAAEIEDLPNVGNVTLDLGGVTKTVRNWEWPGWNGFYMSVSNGTLSVVGRMHPRHGTTDILAGGDVREGVGLTAVGDDDGATGLDGDLRGAELGVHAAL